MTVSYKLLLEDKMIGKDKCPKHNDIIRKTDCRSCKSCYGFSYYKGNDYVICIQKEEPTSKEVV